MPPWVFSCETAISFRCPRTVTVIVCPRDTHVALRWLASVLIIFFPVVRCWFVSSSPPPSDWLLAIILAFGTGSLILSSFIVCLPVLPVFVRTGSLGRHCRPPHRSFSSSRCSISSGLNCIAPPLFSLGSHPPDSTLSFQPSKSGPNSASSPASSSWVRPPCSLLFSFLRHSSPNMDSAPFLLRPSPLDCPSHTPLVCTFRLSLDGAIY